jgi:hypothetical protein
VTYTFGAYLNGAPVVELLPNTGTFNYYLDGAPVLMSGPVSNSNFLRRRGFMTFM